MFLVVSGDIAYSGKVEEYEQAMNFFDKVVRLIREYCNKKIEIILTPGNHDCDFSVNKGVRDIIVKGVDLDNINDEALHLKIKEEMKVLASDFVIYDRATY